MDTSLEVLIVDDSNTVRKVLKKIIVEIGFKKIIDCVNGHVAIQELKNNNIGVILSDWNMPKVNGLELLKFVRAHEEYKKIPFIMLTAESLKNNRDQAIKEGVSGFILKPFNKALILNELEKVFSNPLTITPQEDTHKSHIIPIKESIGIAASKKSDLIISSIDAISSMIEGLISSFSKGITPIISEKLQSLKIQMNRLDEVINNLNQSLTNTKKVENNLANENSVIIVEDEITSRALLKIALKKLGFLNIDEVENARIALEVITKKPFDLVISDMHMPEMTGLELLRFMKNDPILQSIPFLLITVDNEPETIINATMSKLDGYIIKPISFEKLKRKLEQMGFTTI
ncbi:MAG: response regulator [Desulfobacterales bacterium]|nr:response regulator [Desulfobacterales bacterium]